jgi:integrase
MADRKVSEILDKYERVRLPLLRQRTRRDYGRHLASLRKELGERVASELSISELAQHLNVPQGRIHRNRQLAVLSAAFTEAIRWGWLQSNVCKEVARNPAKPRNRPLTDEEFHEARKIARPRVRLVMDLALHTGASQGQLITLRWAQVHEDKILFRNPKTGKKVTVEIKPKIADLLTECGWKSRPRPEYVINTRFGHPYTSEGFRACWQRTMQKWRRMGYDVFTFHDIHRKWVRENPAPPNGTDAPSLLTAGEGQIHVSPKVFRVPKALPVRDAAAVMMPLDPKFDSVYETIRDACADTGFRCQRADDIWEESTIIQDIFNLIYRSHVIIVDFTGRNGNVLYETGIAHALGRHVIPISRSMDDVPFDIKHHRVLRYADDSDAALTQLRQSLAARLRFIGE